LSSASFDADPRAGFDLAGCHLGGQRLGQMPVDGALQLARAVLGAGSLAQQELPALERHLDVEVAVAQARVDVPLQFGDLLVEDGGQRFVVERLVGDDGSRCG
jgi:hypothetical protein